MTCLFVFQFLHSLCLCVFPVSFIDTHSAPPGYFWSCGGSAMWDATPDSPASCRSWPSAGAASSARWPPRCPTSDWLTGRSGCCPRRCGEEGGPQSDTVQPFGRTGLPPAWQVPARRWGWLQGRGLWSFFFKQCLIKVKTKLSTFQLLLFSEIGSFETQTSHLNLSVTLYKAAFFSADKDINETMFLSTKDWSPQGIPTHSFEGTTR